MSYLWFPFTRSTSCGQHHRTIRSQRPYSGLNTTGSKGSCGTVSVGVSDMYQGGAGGEKMKHPTHPLCSPSFAKADDGGHGRLSGGERTGFVKHHSRDLCSVDSTGPQGNSDEQRLWINPTATKTTTSENIYDPISCSRWSLRLRTNTWS